MSEKKLGDGEPSPPPAKCESRFLDEGTIYHCALSAGHEAVHDSHPGVMKKGCLWRDEAAIGGAAQEVSPPSPEPVCPMCCKPVFTDGYEGDTRELKAAARKFLKEVSAYADSDTLSDKALMIAAEEFGRLLG